MSDNPRELTETGESSEIISVTTLDNQKISEWTIDDDSVSPFFMGADNLAENSFISSYSSLNNNAPTSANRNPL